LATTAGLGLAVGPLAGLAVLAAAAGFFVPELGLTERAKAARRAFQESEIPASNGKKIGVGVACAVKNIGFGHAIPEDAGAIVEMDACGNVLVRASQHEYGQGARMGITRLVPTPGVPADASGPGPTPP
jgi:CO/xanthine dehydrogenase Mo-binding subunit